MRELLLEFINPEELSHNSGQADDPYSSSTPPRAPTSTITPSVTACTNPEPLTQAVHGYSSYPAAHSALPPTHDGQGLQTYMYPMQDSATIAPALLTESNTSMSLYAHRPHAQSQDEWARSNIQHSASLAQEAEIEQAHWSGFFNFDPLSLGSSGSLRLDPNPGHGLPGSSTADGDGHGCFNQEVQGDFADRSSPAASVGAMFPPQLPGGGIMGSFAPPGMAPTTKTRNGTRTGSCRSCVRLHRKCKRGDTGTDSCTLCTHAQRECVRDGSQLSLKEQSPSGSQPRPMTKTWKGTRTKSCASCVRLHRKCEWNDTGTNSCTLCTHARRECVRDGGQLSLEEQKPEQSAGAQ